MRIKRVEDLTPGDRLGQPIYGNSGTLLLAPGVSLKPSYISDLRTRGVQAIYVEDDDVADVAPPRAVGDKVRQQVTASMREAFTGVAEALTDADFTAAIQQPADEASSDRALEPLADAVRKPLAGIVGDVGDLLSDTAGEEVINGLGSLRSHDSYTFDHSLDVAAVGLVLARRARWPETRLRQFAIGLLLHDIGKLFVDPGLLNKPGQLACGEVRRMRAHPTLGYRLIRKTLPGIGPLPALVAYQHHERQDGQGYPRKLRGTNGLGQKLKSQQIHDFGSLAAVADVYDALITDRPYRRGLPGDRVHAMIRRGAGTQLNREAVELFEQTVAPFAVCTEVFLHGGRFSGHTAVVTAVRATRLDRPDVRVLRNGSGERVEPFDVRLTDEPEVRVTAEEPRPAHGRVAA